jgi:hypothetical protein
MVDITTMLGPRLKQNAAGKTGSDLNNMVRSCKKQALTPSELKNHYWPMHVPCRAE